VAHQPFVLKRGRESSRQPDGASFGVLAA